MLSAEEEQALARQSQNGDQGAAERLMASHFRLVVGLARKYRGSGIPLSDLIQEGMLGLIQAVKKFDPAQNNRFSTYAQWWVRSAMQDHVVRSWSLVRIGTTNAQKNLFLAVKKALADGPTLPDDLILKLSTKFSTPMAEIKTLAARIKGREMSLDATDPGAEAIVRTMVCKQLNPEENLSEKSEQADLKSRLQSGLDALDPRERIIIMRRHLSELPPSFDTIAREIGLSKERVRVLEKKAMEKLRGLLAGWRKEI